MTPEQHEQVVKLRNAYGTAHVSEEYLDGGVRVVVAFGEEAESSFDVEPDGSRSKTKSN
jgi:hypothetical protein